MKIKSRRFVIPAAVVVVLAAIGVFVWPGFLSTTPDSIPTSVASPATIADGRGETEQDAEEAQRNNDYFDQVITEDAVFYNCTANDEARDRKWRNVKDLIPCGTDIVEIVYVGDTAKDVPEIVTYAGDGGDNVVTFKHGMVDVDGTGVQPMWTVTWTVGQQSTFLQMYLLDYCGAENIQYCWGAITIDADPNTGEFSYALSEGIISIGLVFTDGTSGTAVPSKWWRTTNLRW